MGDGNRSVLLSEPDCVDSDVLGNLKLLPKFSEQEPEALFHFLWPDSARTLKLCVC